ncbi:MAG: fimbrial protein, partial [Chania sp.]
VLIPPCNINGGNDITVDFGTISILNVDGIQGAKSTTVTVNCGYYQGTPYVHVVGTQLVGAPGNVLRPSSDGIGNFGIALYMGSSVNSGDALLLNGSGNGYPITKGLTNINSTSSNFTFTAVPYKTSELQLSTGSFSAGASMAIVYQ